MRTWHGIANSTLRSTKAALQWMREQVSGGFLGHLEEVFLAFRAKGLDAVGFRLPRPGMKASTDEVDDELESECLIAERMGDYGLALVACRLDRMQWLMTGWSCGCVRFLDREPVLASSAAEGPSIR